MDSVKQPQIKVPAAYRRHRRLVAIPEKYLRAFAQYLDDEIALQHIAEAREDLATGNYVIAHSIDEALEKFHAGALGSNP